MFIRENLVILMASYNTSYDVNVTATLCGQYTTATNLALNYGIIDSRVYKDSYSHNIEEEFK